ncbi:MAG: endoglucanase, partial [Myxococcota bacterium]|nr:endoglucanase [Myxococcota bacterium]
SAGGGGTSGGASGSSTGGAATGGAPPVMCTPPEGNNRGFTTRFWDCCKPSCGWPNNAGGKQPAKSCNRQNGGTGANDQSACSGGGAFACFDYSPWAVSEDLSYGYAAFNGAPCGTCFELKFTGESNSQPDDQGAPALCGKRMIVQVVNIGGIEGGQFDLMIPGGGVGDFNACSNQWGVQDDAQLGERYGGLMLACQRKDNELEARKACTLEACNSLFSNGSFSQLLDGCKWTVDWLNTADNPRVVYEQVNCPQELLNKSGLR